MSRFIKYLCVPALAIALLAVANAPSADAANGFSVQIGGRGISTGHAPSHQHVIQPTVRRVYRTYPGHGMHFGRFPSYYDRFHFDYHSSQLVPHNGQIDFVPGHYDFHPTGHWH